MDKLTWTSTKPSEPGWYWWRYGVGDVWPRILEVTREEAGGLGAEIDLFWPNGEFAGPLSPPEG
jgi:hypothetical protein